MKKILSFLLVAVLALSLIACSSNEKKDNPKESKSETVDKSNKETDINKDVSGKLVIWEHQSSFEEPLKAVVEGFNVLYPDVEVEYSIKTSDQYYNLLQTAMQAEETPDLFWTNGQATTNYQAYIDQGLLLDLTDKVDFSLYEDTKAMKLVTGKDGRIYSTPTAEIGGRAVFYNKDIFEENNWTIPKTFSEFEKLLENISKTDYVPIAIGATDPWNILFIWEPILAATHLDWIQEYENEGYAAVNDDRVVDAYNKMIEWGDKGYFGNNWAGVSGQGSSLAFSTGEAVMYIGGTWNIATFHENNPALNFGAFQIPTDSGEIPFVSTTSCGFAISSATENEPAAVAFANYFASEDGQTRWMKELGAISSVSSIVSENSVVNDIQNGYTVQATSYYDILGFLAGNGDSPNNVWEEDQTKIFTGGLGVQEFVNSLQELCLTKEEVLSDK